MGQTSTATIDDAKCYDVIVIGAGFGGLGAALKAVDRGRRVLVLEAIHYPGGCAGRFTRHGVEWDAGATLFSGFAPGDLFASWNDRFQLGLQWRLMDPVATVCSPTERLTIPRDRDAFVESLAGAPNAPAKAIRAFFREQQRIAEPLWQLLKQPELLPPLGTSALLQHMRRGPRYLPALRWFGRPLVSVLEAFGLHEYKPLRNWIDAACQVTVQASAAEADAIFALGAMDYDCRGIAHIEGGGGAVAPSLVNAIEARGGVVKMRSPVTRLHQTAARDWTVATKHNTYTAPLVIANLLPQNLSRLLDTEVLPQQAPLCRVVGVQSCSTSWSPTMVSFPTDRRTITSLATIPSRFWKGTTALCRLAQRHRVKTGPNER